MENKNLLLAIVLSVGFLFLWSIFVIPKFAPPRTARDTGGTPPSGTATSPTLLPAHPDAARVAPDAILRDPENEIIFAPQGGGIRHWRLKLKGQEIDLVEKPESLPPLASFPDAVFTVRQRANESTLQTTLPNGLRFTQTLVLNPGEFLHNLTFQFENPAAQPVELKDWKWGWGPGLGTVATENKENSRLIRALSKDAVKAHSLKPGEYPTLGEWAAIDNRYFLVAFLPLSAGNPRLRVEKVSLLNTQGKEEHHLQIRIYQNVTIPPHGNVSLTYQIYAGPKGYTHLKHYKKGLEAAVDFGRFSVLGKLVLRALYWLQRQTGNYGWAIVILTICLQIMLFPLTIKSFKATMAMKELQPQIAVLQKVYKADPKRLNLEMLNLYKKSGTNPFGGCLPMLLQLPIFWALFTTLRNAYELRGTPWIGWIHDLSAADPYRVLPIVMGGFMFLQQRISGAVTDPTQRQMMYFMPVMFTVMFMNFSSGLVLYWLVQNIVTMIIQWSMLRMHHKNKNPTLEVVP